VKVKMPIFFEKISQIFLVIIFFAGYGLILCGIFYSHPNAEDFSLVNGANKAGLINSIVQLLISYDGRYFTNLLHGLNPLAFGWVGGYSYTIGFGVLFSIFSFWYFLNSVLPKTKALPLIVYASLFLLINMALTPSLPHLIYWMVSSFVYLYAWCFWLLWMGAFFRFLKSKSELSRFLYFTACAFLIVCAMGINEMFLIINVGTMLFFNIYTKSQYPHLFKYSITLFGVMLVSLLFFISNPGISERFSSFEETRSQFHFIEVFTLMFQHSTIISIKWFFKGLIMPLFLIWTIAFLFKHNLFFNIEINKKAKYWVVTTLILFPFTMLFAFYIPMVDKYVPERVYTSFFLVFQLSLFMVVLLFGNSLKLSAIFSTEAKLNTIMGVASVCMLILLFISNNNLKLIVTEKLDGTLDAYNNTMNKRYSILSATKSCEADSWKVAVLPQIDKYPKSIYMNPDIKPNKQEFYWNNAYEIFFDVDEIRLHGDTVTTFQFIDDLLNE
jgi:hypothetical protein